jgi:hypothetical protein
MKKKVASVTTRFNEYNVCVWHFYTDLEETNEVGHMFRTFHPTIPFEVFRTDKGHVVDSKRVSDTKEATEWFNCDKEVVCQ